MVIFLFTT